MAEPGRGHLEDSSRETGFEGSYPHVPLQLQAQGRKLRWARVLSLPSEPAITAEIHTQRLLVCGAKLLQGGSAGASIVAKPVHGLLQPGDPKAPGHL